MIITRRFRCLLDITHHLSTWNSLLSWETTSCFPHTHTQTFTLLLPHTSNSLCKSIIFIAILFLFLFFFIYIYTVIGWMHTSGNARAFTHRHTLDLFIFQMGKCIGHTRMSLFYIDSVITQFRISNTKLETTGTNAFVNSLILIISVSLSILIPICERKFFFFFRKICFGNKMFIFPKQITD